MEGEFILNEDAKNALVTSHNLRVSKVFGVISVFFIAISFIQDKNLELTATISFTIICIGVIGIFLRTLFGNKLADTIIVLEDNIITRRGANLLEVTISYKNIKRIKEKSIGLIILDDSPYTSVEYYTSKYALSSGEGVIFIPKEIECFDEIREFLYSKTNVSVRYSF